MDARVRIGFGSEWKAAKGSGGFGSKMPYRENSASKDSEGRRLRVASYSDRRGRSGPPALVLLKIWGTGGGNKDEEGGRKGGARTTPSDSRCRRMDDTEEKVRE